MHSLRQEWAKHFIENSNTKKIRPIKIISGQISRIFLKFNFLSLGGRLADHILFINISVYQFNNRYFEINQYTLSLTLTSMSHRLSPPKSGCLSRTSHFRDLFSRSHDQATTFLLWFLNSWKTWSLMKIILKSKKKHAGLENLKGLHIKYWSKFICLVKLMWR